MLEGLTITGITLTPEACSDILETAIEAGHTYGFGYWAKLLKTDVSFAKRDAAFFLAITIRETQGPATNPKLPGREFTVTHPMLQAAVLKMVQDPKGCGCRGLVPQLLGSDGLDGPIAEAIIQVACFGEVIYG